jgi:hypothetical protein
MTERERFFELLPFYVNDTLGEADRAFVRDMLVREPALQGQLDFHRAVQRQVRSETEATLVGVARDVGYDHIATRLRPQAAQVAPSASPAATASPSAWQRLRDWFALPAPGGWRLAQGLAMGLALGLGSLLAVNLTRDEAPQMRGTGSAASKGLADGPLLRVTFRPEASERNLRMALVEARAMIVAGPTRLGDYYLKPAPGALAQARDALLKSGVAQQVDEVPGLPPELTE